MPLPSSGVISLNDIQTEFGGTNPIGLDEYYRGGSNVPNITANNSIPTSGAIALSNFYGARVASYVSILSRTSSSNDEITTGVDVDTSENAYIVGYDSTIDIEIAKVDKNGSPLWIRVLNGGGTERGWDIAVDSSGSAYIVGTTNSVNANADIFLAKYNTSGVLQWQTIIGASTTTENAFGIALDSSGNIYVTGIYSSGTSKMLVAKCSNTGVLSWVRVSDSSIDSYGYKIAVDSAGNSYIAGVRFSASTGADIFIVRMDGLGQLSWQRAIAVTGDDTGYDIALDSSSNVYIVGTTSASGGWGAYDLFLAKYNSSGTLQWQRILGGSNSDYGYGVSIDPQNNVYVCGSTVSANTDCLVAKYDSNGNLLWQRSMNVGFNDIGNGIKVYSNHYYVAMRRQPLNSSDGILCVTKFPIDGSLTGTYSSGTFTYASTTLSSGASSFTSSTPTGSFSTRTMSNTTTSFTSSDPGTSFSSNTLI